MNLPTRNLSRLDISIQSDSDRFAVNFGSGDGVPSRAGYHQGFTRCRGSGLLKINFYTEFAAFYFDGHCHDGGLQ